MEVDSIRLGNVQQSAPAPSVSPEAAAAYKAPKVSALKEDSVSIGNDIEREPPEEMIGRGEQESDEKITGNFVKKAIDEANVNLRPSGRSLQYSIHQRTGQIMVKVIDEETKEVIREIPPEKVLDAYVKMLELAGVLVDKKG